MYLLFLDESGTPPKPEKAEGKYLVIGGVIIPEGAWHAIKKEFNTIKLRFKIRDEIKWKYFGSPKSEDNPLWNLTREEKDKLREALLSILTSRKAIKLICCVTCVDSAYRMDSVKNQNDIYALTYKGVTERFQYFLQDATRVTGQQQFGMVISDHRMKQDDESLRARHHDLIDNEVKYTSNYQNIIETILFSPSHVSAGLQLADLVAGAVHRAYQYHDPRFAALIRSAFRTSAKGEIVGWGLVKMPKAEFIEPKREPSGGEAFTSPTR